MAAKLSSKAQDVVITTIGSHSALQILKGARDEGVRNLVICKKGSERPYQSYGVADEIITLNDWSDWNDEFDDMLAKRNAIIIPHGSFIAYMGPERVAKMNAKYFGTKGILQWESDRAIDLFRALEQSWHLDIGLGKPLPLHRAV
jgi:5-formaminoimidazole-4-carboxamide-1-(beta)-D-ribofuranosyl 5'-monophosphate synthetase